jgi:hypothetical protein
VQCQTNGQQQHLDRRLQLRPNAREHPPNWPRLSISLLFPIIRYFPALWDSTCHQRLRMHFAPHRLPCCDPNLTHPSLTIPNRPLILTSSTRQRRIPHQCISRQHHNSRLFNLPVPPLSIYSPFGHTRGMSVSAKFYKLLSVRFTQLQHGHGIRYEPYHMHSTFTTSQHHS